MKLRISGNSLRLRLTRSEVEEFAKTGSYESAVNFGTGRLTYRLENTPEDDRVSAALVDDTLTVRVPESAAVHWTTSEDVGIEAADGDDLKIVIEKDFACLKPRDGEDTDDHYPHPATGAAC